MSTICYRTRLGHAILLALLASAQASAQEVNKPDAADSATLGTIMVTAEKRSEDIQQVPMSISVIDVSTLENLHATQLSDYAGYIPGFTVINGGSPGQASLGVRGITPLSAGSTVATYIDETPLGTSSNYGGGSNSVVDLLPYDFQSVEVLRGPQGTLYGASALGGVLRYVTRQPDLNTWSWRFGADAFSRPDTCRCCGRRVTTCRSRCRRSSRKTMPTAVLPWRSIRSR
jgi:outer membrane receptor protein involved in Fe transport